MVDQKSESAKDTPPLDTLRKMKESQPEPTPSESPEKRVPLSELQAFDATMLGLFFVDLETQTQQLTEGLLALEANAQDAEALSTLMRAAHSIKGAARVLGLESLVELARSIEGYLFALKENPEIGDPDNTDLVLSGVDLFASLVAITPENIAGWLEDKSEAIAAITTALKEKFPANGEVAPEPSRKKKSPPPRHARVPERTAPPPVVPEVPPSEPDEALATANKRLLEARQMSRLTKRDRVLRLTADYLTRLMGLAGELLVESRWLQPFADELLKLKKAQYELSSTIDALRASFDEKLIGEDGQQYLLELQRKTNGCRENLAHRLDELELFIRRHAGLSDRLYREVISSRLCPFSEGTEDLPRMVRDLSRQLNKKVSLEIIGRATTIDRDILDKLQSPLHHLLRNAIDHGIESPEERIAKGKKPEGLIRLEARHRAGVLGITVSDDGRGINLAQLRNKIIEKKLIDPAMAQQLTDSELLDFLFLPGFTTASQVTDISGRGIGLNVVQSMVHDVGGQVRVHATDGHGMTFHLQLPLTLSVLRALLVEIAGEPYAFPLARIERSMVMDRSRVEVVEQRQYVGVDHQNIGLVAGYQILGFEAPKDMGADIALVVLSDNFNSYGVVVDRLLGEKELVVQELDPRIGKVSDISCGAFMEDGSPVLVIDVEDMVRSIDNLLTGGHLERLSEGENAPKEERRKRILVVDDSITVREVECRILENAGYEVGVAVNGVDGWNSVRIEEFDLVVTDVDMPRMNGIELVRQIKNDPRLGRLPVMIVSYKERGEDRKMGLDAGADFYLAKSSFHDDTFLETVKDLLGDGK
jgi:two-component system sensor histidine kinase and response regulator WspE